jgi:hypothetical protein
MPLSSIVVILIRLFALNWLLTSLSLLLSAAGNSVAYGLMPYVPGAVLLVVTVVLWVFARAIARIVSSGVDASVSVGSLTRSDLYSFAFVFIGLFFVLSSFADVINWVHYFTTVSHENPRHDPRVQSFYQLTRPCLTLALGLILLFGAPRWTKMLIARDQKDQVA